MDPGIEDESLRPRTHPLKIFDAAKAQRRFVYACAPMVRYSKLAFRQTVHHYGTDLCWTPMILAKEFNRNQVARDSDLTISSPASSFLSSVTAATTTTGSEAGAGTAKGGKGVLYPGELPTIAQFGANSAAELARAASLAAPFVNGVDLNCGCPQSWACAEDLGAALMQRRELVRDMLAAARSRLARDGWQVGLGPSSPDPDSAYSAHDSAQGRGRSVSVKIRVHKDVRRTMDFIHTVLGDGNSSSGGGSVIDFLTIHPRTRHTPSSAPIDLDALAVLTDTFGDRVPILISGDVFALSALPYTSPLLPDAGPTFTTTTTATTTSEASSSSPSPSATPTTTTTKPHLPKLAGLMSARALLANPALFAGHDACPWAAVDVFMGAAARAPLPLKLAVHHLSEMCGPGFGPRRDRNGDGAPLLSKRERARLTEFGNWIDVVDFMDEMRRGKTGEEGGIVRFA